MRRPHEAATVLAVLGLARVFVLPSGLRALSISRWSLTLSYTPMPCMCFPVGCLRGASVLRVINEYIKLKYYVIAY